MSLLLDRYTSKIGRSNYISRDLSWLKFNYRVLDQARHPNRNVLERLKFLAITASNLDEFFMIRVGSLYNYLDYGKERLDYSGLREIPFRNKLLSEVQRFSHDSKLLFTEDLRPAFAEFGFNICKVDELSEEEARKVKQYFKKTIYPMLTPMVYDIYHPFPILMNKVLTFAVVTRGKEVARKKESKKLSFVQIPQNLPRFYEISRRNELVFVPIEEVIRSYIETLFKNVEVVAVDLMRLTRNGDFTLDESDDLETDFLEELRGKLKTRRTGRVVRIEIESGFSRWTMKRLRERWDIVDDNIIRVEYPDIIDYTGLWQIVNHEEFKNEQPIKHPHVRPLSYPDKTNDIFLQLKERDILLHHPYNNMEPLLELIEQASIDPNVLAIKITIYRLAEDSRVTNALLKAAENGKHVSVLFEVKARFDEENNMKEAQRLQKAGCFVIYGISTLKTHTKLLLIVRKEGSKVTRFVHMSSGNYNESTSRLYTDIGILSTNEVYAEDVNEFFNVITGHSEPVAYRNLITAPGNMRDRLIDLINHEAKNASEGKKSGIVIKVNSLQDKAVIDALYNASKAGVPIKLIVRGICCLRPGRKGLSETIEVRSIVGEFLEHSRMYYFHNDGMPKVYGGSADMMGRSFDRRLESLFLITDEFLQQQTINILVYNLRDNCNAYQMQEDGSYTRIKPKEDADKFNIHEKFFKVTNDIVNSARLFD